MSVWRPEVAPVVLHFFARDLAGVADLTHAHLAYTDNHPMGCGYLIVLDTPLRGEASTKLAEECAKRILPDDYFCVFCSHDVEWAAIYEEFLACDPIQLVRDSKAIGFGITVATGRPTLANNPCRLRLSVQRVYECWPNLTSPIHRTVVNWLNIALDGGNGDPGVVVCIDPPIVGAYFGDMDCAVLVECPPSAHTATWRVGMKLLVAARDHAKADAVTDTWFGPHAPHHSWNNFAPSIVALLTEDLSRMEEGLAACDEFAWRRCVNLSFALFLLHARASRSGQPILSSHPTLHVNAELVEELALGGPAAPRWASAPEPLSFVNTTLDRLRSTPKVAPFAGFDVADLGLCVYRLPRAKAPALALAREVWRLLRKE